MRCNGKKEGEPLAFNDEFQLLHTATDKYVRFSNGQPYSEFNCGRGCALAGQLELHAVKEDGKDTYMRAISGMAIVD